MSLNGRPVPRQELVDAVDRVAVSEAVKDICQPGPRFDVIEFRGGDQGGDCRPSVGATVGAGEEVVLATERDRTDGAFNGVGIEVNPTILEEPAERQPSGERIADRLGETAALWQARQLMLEPGLQVVHDREGPRAPGGVSAGGGTAPDLRLDRVERCDPAQDLLRDRRASRLMYVVKLAPCVRPAGGQIDVAPCGQRLEAGISVNLQDTAERLQMRSRTFGTTVRTITIENRRRIIPAAGSVVPGLDPEPPGTGAPAAWIENRQDRVIGDDPLRRHDVIGNLIADRSQPPGSARHPVGQRRAVQRDALAAEDLALAVERKVIAIFADQHLRQQRRRCQPPGDRPFRRRRLVDGSASPAAVFGASDTHGPQLRGHMVAHLADRLADHV